MGKRDATHDASETPTATAVMEVDERDAEIERLRAELAKRPALPTPEEIAALPRYRCYVETHGGKTDENGLAVAECFDDPDSPRLAEIVEGRKWFASSLQTLRIVRDPATGKETGTEDRFGHNNGSLPLLRDELRAWIANGCAHKHVSQHQYGMSATATAEVSD